MGKCCRYKKNEFGDHQLDLEGKRRQYVNKVKGSLLAEDELWEDDLESEESDNVIDEDDDVWRYVDKVIYNSKFTTEALSWKGYDYALLKLRGTDGHVNYNGSIAPACLASSDYDLERRRDSTYYAGYGRRFVPFCVTDDRGPDAFGICGRPKNCRPRTDECGVDFLYKGRRHKECIKDQVHPSALHPICQSLRKQVRGVENTSKIIHIFKGSKFVTTCYPAEAVNGWCGTRRPGVDVDSEPKSNSGWGFCSGDKSQRFCNQEVPSGYSDSTAFAVQLLTDDYCVKELGANLAVEQPNVKEREYRDVRDKYGVICVGKNHTHEYDEDLFFQISGKSRRYRMLESTLEMKKTVSRKSPTKSFAVNGPICFGDSGGPLFQLYYDAEAELVKPVIVGVFSFILWGTCQGANEPAYFGKVQHLEKWLRQYLGDQVCWV